VTPVLEARGLAVGRGGRAVLRDIALAVHPGERLALVGGNGCGKSTLLRALAGLAPPLAGQLRWAGGPLPRGTARVRTVGVLLQSESPPAFTVRALVTLGLALDGPPAPDALRQVDATLAWAGLADRAERRCGTLSGGEWQRALLARAAVAQPRLLLLDEPTNHLDPAGQAALLARLDTLRGDTLRGDTLYGKPAVILATHDLAVAARCHRVALLAAGRLSAVGTPAAVLTPERLAMALGVQISRFDDPAGGPPLLRVEVPSPLQWAPGRATETAA
jgi:iron complex transport system ATP-binding protein